MKYTRSGIPLHYIVYEPQNPIKEEHYPESPRLRNLLNSEFSHYIKPVLYSFQISVPLWFMCVRVSVSVWLRMSPCSPLGPSSLSLCRTHTVSNFSFSLSLSLYTCVCVCILGENKVGSGQVGSPSGLLWVH